MTFSRACSILSLCTFGSQEKLNGVHILIKGAASVASWVEGTWRQRERERERKRERPCVRVRVCVCV